MPEADPQLNGTRKRLMAWKDWALSTTGILPASLKRTTYEDMLMKYGHRLRGTNEKLPDNPLCEEVEAQVITMPEGLQKYVVTEYLHKGTATQKARDLGVTRAPYYSMLRAAHWYLFGRGIR